MEKCCRHSSAVNLNGADVGVNGSSGGGGVRAILDREIIAAAPENDKPIAASRPDGAAL